MVGFPRTSPSSTADVRDSKQRFARRRATSLGVNARLMIVVTVAAGVSLLVVGAPQAGASPDSGVLTLEGSAVVAPLMDQLAHNESPSLTPLIVTFTSLTGDQAIGDFAGTGTGQFVNDVAVSERPLTTAEAAADSADGRSYTYVPFAAVPIAMMTFAPDPNKYAGSNDNVVANMCQHPPLSLGDLDQIFGPTAVSWSNFQCSAGGAPVSPVPVSLWANDDPSVENEVVMNLLDSTTASQKIFAQGLQQQYTHSGATTTKTTPSEIWPLSANKIFGGDDALIGKMANLNSESQAPEGLQLGSMAPISNIWMGDPEGAQWNFPTAAIQDAAGAYVPPSAVSATAAEAHTTLSASSDPTQDNLVTFNADPSDTTAYNNYMMVPEYLVVPTNGLSAAKASALAQFIRFLYGPTAQSTIQDMGAAPADAAMATAGLAVARTIDQGILPAPATSPSTNPTGVAAPATNTSGTATTPAASTVSTSSAAGNSLAFTGFDPVPTVVVGGAMFGFATYMRRRIRRREPADAGGPQTAGLVAANKLQVHRGAEL